MYNYFHLVMESSAHLMKQYSLYAYDKIAAYDKAGNEAVKEIKVGIYNLNIFGE